MKILSNLPEPTFIAGMTQLLAQTLGLARSRVYVITPWIRDVELPLAQAGFFDGLLANRDTIPFVELLRLVAGRHELTVITKPPEELIDLTTLRRLEEKLATQRELRQSDEARGISVIELLAGQLEQDIRDLVDDALTHWDTLRIAWELGRAGANVYYARKLHAKLLWTAIGAIAGSANFTGGGFAGNDELMVEMTEEAVLIALRGFADGLTHRAVVAREYRIAHALERSNLSATQLEALLVSALAAQEPALRELLQILRGMA